MRNLLSLFIALPLLAQTPAGQPAAQEAKPQTPAGQSAVQEAKPQTAAAPAAEPAAAPAAEDWITGSVDVGYRFLTDVRGDFNTYRSVVNLGEGPKLLNADFTIQPLNHRFADRIDVHANSWGGDPYNTFRLDARRQGLYRFTFDYRNIAYYNFLPSFANPGTTNPTLPFLNQYGFDTHRRVSNTELELFPGGRIIPYVAYSRSGGRDNGTSNLILEGDEYTVPTLYNDHTDELRAGVRFEYNRWHATFEGGSLNFRDDQELTQSPTLTNPGNVLTPFIGQQLFLTAGHAQYGIRGSGAFTRAVFTANPTSWADVSAQFLYSQPKTDIHFTQSSTGNLFDFATAAFYTSALLDRTGTAHRPNPSGNVSLTLKPFGGRMRILESWMTNRLHTAGSLLLLDQLLTEGATPTQRSLADAARFVANYNQQELNVLFDATSFLTLRGGHRYVWGDTTASPPSFLIEGQGLESERGTLRRNVGLAGFTVRAPSDIRVNVDFEGSPGDRAYFRTSLNEYIKSRISARWQALPALQLTARFNVLSNQNPDPLINYDFLSRDNTFTAHFTPGAWKGFGILADYTRSTLRSEIQYLIPSELSTATSVYRENGHTGTLLADIPLPGGTHRPALSFGGSFYRSQGTRPVRFWQPMARFALPISANVQFNTEWRWYAMSQPFYLYEGFRSHQFVIGLRYSR